MDIECGCGKSFSSRVLGGRTSCPKCKKGYYIRKDGTTGPRAATGAPTPPPVTPGIRRPTRKVTKVAYARTPNEPDQPDDTEEPHESEPPAKRSPARIQRTKPTVRKRTGRTAAPANPPPAATVDPGRGKSQGKQRRSGPYDTIFGW